MAENIFHSNVKSRSLGPRDVEGLVSFRNIFSCGRFSSKKKQKKERCEGQTVRLLQVLVDQGFDRHTSLLCFPQNVEK